MKNQQGINKLEDVPSGITKFMAIMKAYKDVGGTPPEGHELKTDFLDTLPSEVREQLMWRVNNTDEPFASFTEHVRATCQSILFHRGKYAPINRVEPELQGAEPDDTGFDEEINAVMRRWGKKPGGDGRPGKGAGRGDRPPRAAAEGGRDLKCTNCGGPHMAESCSKPKLAISDRPSRTCGKKHLMEDCHDNPRHKPKGIRNGVDPGGHVFCLVH